MARPTRVRTDVAAFFAEPANHLDRPPSRPEPLSGAAVGHVVASRGAAVGLGYLRVTGHSLRAGHATTAAEAGVPAERLMRTTRHRSLATLATYTRPADTLRDTSSSSLGL